MDILWLNCVGEVIVYVLLIIGLAFKIFNLYVEIDNLRDENVQLKQTLKYRNLI